MMADLESTGKLLEALGTLTGQAFRVLPVDDPPRGEDEVSDAAVGLLKEDPLHAERPCFRRTASGRWIGGVSLPLKGRRHFLYSWLDPHEGGNDGRERGILDLLQCIRQMAQERKEPDTENEQLAAELNLAYEELHLFSRIAAQVRSLRYSEEALRDLLHETREAMRVDVAAALFEKHEAVDVVAGNADFTRLVPEPADLLGRLSVEMFRSAPAFEGSCYIVNSSTDLPMFAAMHPLPYRALAVGMRNGERLYGRLLLVSFKMNEVFRRGEYRLLSSMAEQIALVLANTELYRDLELFVISLVKSFVTAIEAKDPYTRGHSERVNRLSMLLADAMHLDGKPRNALQWASVLHDVGKIGTPELILNKPGRLSDAEYDSIKEHPSKGAKILGPIAQLAEAIPAIRHHHERFDGRGYPDHLAGEAIPLLARIIAVADTYDAVTSTRAYRAARSHEEAMRIIRECSGTQLDPAVVETFASAIRDADLALIGGESPDSPSPAAAGGRTDRP
jgi:putative nucleotidyltransferase with HDIG domain